MFSFFFIIILIDLINTDLKKNEKKEKRVAHFNETP